jgi:hypothetical protein
VADGETATLKKVKSAARLPLVSVRMVSPSLMSSFHSANPIFFDARTYYYLLYTSGAQHRRRKKSPATIPDGLFNDEQQRYNA